MALIRLALLFLMECLATTTLVVANNDYPVVLVHGLAGWGRDEMLGFKYWGKLQGDLEQQLNDQGFKVLIATVGPLSSNWDRAVELYYQIKGGQVDYGKNHSSFHGHKRFGRIVPLGLYPEWGTKDAHGNTRKIHLIDSHMGGQTIRMLAQLLAQGSKGAPIEEDPATSSELFQGGHNDYIHSITTISTPNQGTLLADGALSLGNAVESVVGGLIAIIGLAGDTSKHFYDTKLDQWGLGAQQPDETLVAYIQRVLASRLFQPGFKDICKWSLSTAGAKEESTWVKTHPSIYYFSYATRDTFAAQEYSSRNIQLPNLFTMLPLLDPLATFLGSRYGPNHGFSESWQPNDGVVNTDSMFSDGLAEVVAYQGIAYRGKWNRMPVLDRMDHAAVVGFTLHTNILKMYSHHLNMLRKLPIMAQDAAVIETDSLASVVDLHDVYDLESSRVDTLDDLQALCASARSSSSYARAYCAMLLAHASAATQTNFSRVI